MKTDWSRVKCYSFPLKGMTNPTDIMKVMKRLGIKKYIYEIRCENITIKYGMSDPNTTQPGERIYRQIGHLDSWGPSVKLYGQNGQEFILINDEFKQLYGHDMLHTNIVVSVWDFDNYPFQTINTFKEVNSAEIELIENFNKIYGELPIGNVDDGTLFYKKSAPLKIVYESLFGE